MPRSQAVRAMHFPKDLAEYKQALRRIKFEELFYFQMQLQTLKSENKVHGSGLVLNWSQKTLTAVKEKLPFALTQAQEKSLQEILTDMKSDHHMNRLLQGGCRKWEDSGCRSCYVCSCNGRVSGCPHGSNRDSCRAAF